MFQVLVVEDESLVSDVLGYELSAAGFAVRTARDGPGALAAAQVERPDAVVLDIKMPGMDGKEVFRRLRASAPNLPVFVFSARGDCAELRAELAGLSGCFAKSAELGPLIGALRAALGSDDGKSLPGEVVSD